MKLMTLDGTPATFEQLTERAEAWYELHGEDGMSGWPLLPVTASQPFSVPCLNGAHGQCRGTRVRGVGSPCRCPHHDA